MLGGSLKKRQRVGSSGRLLSSSSPSSLHDLLDGNLDNSAIFTPTPGGFNDAATADVVLRLSLDPDAPPTPFSPTPSDTQSSYSSDSIFFDLHLHSSILRRSQYFSAVLSDPWQQTNQGNDTTSRTIVANLSIKVPLCSHSHHCPFDSHVKALRLLYTLDFQYSIGCVSDALDLLHVSLELLFDDCVRACVKFLEAVPWTEEEERLVLKAIPFLRHEESKELLTRVMIRAADGFEDSSEEMLHGLVISAIHSHPTIVNVKAFVAKILKDYSARDSVRRVLDRVFLSSLQTMMEMLSDYTSPDFRVAGDNNETEAIQRLNLHAAVVNTRKLLWLVERMIDLRVADAAVKEWSDQVGLAADLRKAFRDDAWRNIAPGLLMLVMKCTGRLASAVASGSVLATTQVRIMLVKNWLPVLNVCRDIVSPIPSSQKLLYQELEETFLRIISTLPTTDSRELLQRCLSFSTRNIEECPHLISAFNTFVGRILLLMRIPIDRILDSTRYISIR